MGNHPSAPSSPASAAINSNVSSTDDNTSPNEVNHKPDGHRFTTMSSLCPVIKKTGALLLLLLLLILTLISHV